MLDEFTAATRVALSPLKIFWPRRAPTIAALLFDLAKVDIRRVGTQQKRILVVGCSA
jgi:hypothetical protein